MSVTGSAAPVSHISKFHAHNPHCPIGYHIVNIIKIHTVLHVNILILIVKLVGSVNKNKNLFVRNRIPVLKIWFRWNLSTLAISVHRWNGIHLKMYRKTAHRV